MSADEASPTTAIARFFGSLTNALLDLGLPTITKWLRDRVGDGADIAQITTDGALIHLDGVRIPVGPRGLVVLTRATAWIVSPTKIRLHAFQGALAFGKDAASSFVADVAFVSTASEDDTAWVSGELTIGRASWTTADAHAHAPMSGRAFLHVAESNWKLEGGELRGEVAVARFHGTGSTHGQMPRDARLALEKCRVGPFVDAAIAILGRPLALPRAVPLDARLEGTLGWRAEGGGECDLTVTAEAGTVTLRAAVSNDGKGVQGRIEGAVRPAVLLRAGGLPDWAPRDEDAIAVVADVEGPLALPKFRGTFRGSEVGFRFGRARYLPATVVREIDGTLEGRGDEIRVKVTARGGQGTLSVDLVGFARDASTFRGTGRIEEVDGAWLKGVLPALGMRRPFPIDLHVSADVALGVAFSLTGRGRVWTPRSDFAVDPLEFRGGDAAGTRIRGCLAAADLIATGLLDLAVRPDPVGVLDLDVAIERGNVARADASIATITLRVPSREDVGPFVLTDVHGKLSLDAKMFRYEDVRCSAFGGSFELGGAIPLRVGEEDGTPRLVLSTARADASLVRAALSFGRVRPTLPDGVVVRGKLRIKNGIAAEVELETMAGTALAIEAHLDSGSRLDRSRVRGTVVLADVLTVAQEGDLPFRGNVAIDLDVSGPTTDPTIAGHLACSRLAVAAFVLEDVALLLHADARRFAWNHLEATAYEGALLGSGLVGYTKTFSDLLASFTAKEIAVEAIPQLSGAVGGRFGGKIDIVRAGSLRGGGAVSLSAPAFPVLEKAREPLQRFGLVPPEPGGTRAAVAVVELGDRGVRFADVKAAVPGCSVLGDVLIDWDGTLRAVASVTLEEEYLASSKVLAVPKVLAQRITIPIRLSGSVAAPVVKANLGEALGRFARDNKVREFLTGAVEEVAILLGKEPVRESDAPRRPVAIDQEIGARLARMLTTAADWDALAHRRAETVTDGRVRVGS